MTSRLKPLPLAVLSLLGGNLIGTALAADEAVLDTVVVTGTRSAGRQARSSATPIDVINAEQLLATGQSNLLDALKTVLPSLNTPAVGYDVGALARTFQLRGLSPAHTLVLVNGKRRHLSASIYADSDPAQGANAVDLDMIPLSAIDHVEVLKDGAAAQYGSDAIAGVVNIILRRSDGGGSVSVQGGRYGDGGGASVQLDGTQGLQLGGHGQLQLAAGLRTHGFSNRSGDSGGVQPARVQGDPRSQLATASFNLEQPLAGGLGAYGFGTLARRQARAYENPRQPGWFSAAVDTLYPDGFSPQETVNELDYSLTGGVKGRAGDAWQWDLSATLGRDDVRLRNIHTVNPDLLDNTGNAQTDFRVGGFTASALTSNLDLRRPVALPGLAGPLNLALGLEARREGYQIHAGEPNAYYLGGPQAFPGFRPSDAADVGRNSAAVYGEATANLTPAWELSLAAREERHGGVGSRLAGKLSSRFVISPQWALRGSLGNGFHAPTLAQQTYSATTVTNGFAQIQLPLGTAGARLLGAPDLQPETSRNLTAGVVAEPVKGVHASLDAYRIDIDKRIIQSAALTGPLAAAAITANGSSIPAGVPADGVTAAFFTNGVDTRTTGVDLSLDWRQDLGSAGLVKWTVASGYTHTRIRRIHDAPAVLQAAGLTLVDGVQRSNLTTATPRQKSSLSATLLRGDWALTLRESFYGATSQVQGYGAGPYYDIRTRSAWLTDVDLGWHVNDRLSINVGANNLFNRYPTEIPAEVYRNLNYDRYSHVSPFGINGGYYYLRLSSNF